jgi:hypothetical protein
VDYVKTDIEVIGHVLISEKQVVVFGISPEVDSAVASVIIAEHTEIEGITWSPSGTALAKSLT